MNPYRTAIAWTATVLFFAGTAPGQVATGLPPFGSFSGGPFDIVNNANLNVHFEIPVVNKAGRGMPFFYILSYDSAVWYPVSVNGTQTWIPVANWGWRAITEAETGFIAYSATLNSCTISGTTYYWTI